MFTMGATLIPPNDFAFKMTVHNDTPIKKGMLATFFHRRHHNASSDQTTHGVQRTPSKIGRMQAWIKQSLSRDSFDESKCADSPMLVTFEVTSKPRPTERKENAFGSWVARLSGRRQQQTKSRAVAPAAFTSQLDKRETMSEEDLVSKSLSNDHNKTTTDNSTMHLQSAYSEESVYKSTQRQNASVTLTSRTPSYLRLSCALNGYRCKSNSNLNRATLPARATPMIYDAHFANQAAIEHEPLKAAMTSRYGEQPIGAPSAPGRSNVERRRDVFEQVSKDEAKTQKRPKGKPPPVPPRQATTHLSTVSESSATTRSILGGLSSPEQQSSSMLDELSQMNGELNGVHHQDYPTSSAIKNGNEFEMEAQKLRASIEEKCAILTEILNNEIDADGVSITDEGAGAIRLAIGKAKLLMNKKLSKFDELVHSHLHDSRDTETPTLIDDLRGFWDLMMIDVDDVQSCLEDVDALRRNKWQPVTSPKRLNAAPKSARVTSSVKNTSSKSPLSARANDARRRRLVDAINAGRAQKQTQNDCDIIFH